MENNKRNFRNEVRDFWNENRDKIKIGLKCLGIGLAIGFVKGGMTGIDMQRDTVSRLIDKIPHEPDFDDIADSGLTLENDVLSIACYKHFIVLDEAMSICMKIVDLIKEAQEN